MKNRKSFIIGASFITVGILGAVLFVVFKPQAKKRRPPRMTPVVEVVELKRQHHVAELNLMGTIIPAEAIDLKPRVSGEIVNVHSNWIEGGRINAGETVAALDQRDYEIALEKARSAHVKASSELALEMGRQDVAKSEWALLGEDGSARDRELALRVPQLKSAKASEVSAGSSLKKAELDLERTRVKAPFDAVVLQRKINLGDQASPQASMGQLVRSDVYHVRVSIPVNEVKWIELPGNGSEGSLASVTLSDGSIIQGRVIKALPDLEKTGRMARLLVEIKNPVADTKQVFLGSYVSVRIVGKGIPGSYSVSRNHFHDGGSIWLLKPDNTLRVLSVQPVWGNRKRVVFTDESIREGERLIVSDLSMLIDGMDLRLPAPAVEKKPSGKKGRIKK